MRHVGHVDGDQSDVCLLLVSADGLVDGLLLLNSADEDDSVAFDGSVLLKTRWLELELLLVAQVVHWSVGGDTHDDLLKVGSFRLLKSLELRFLECADSVVFEVVLLSADQDSLVVLLKGRVVIGETFAELVFLLLVIEDHLLEPLENVEGHNGNEQEEGSGVVGHLEWVGVSHGGRKIVAGKLDVTGSIQDVGLGFEDLTVAHLPEDEWQAHGGKPSDKGDGLHGDLFIETGWLSVVVADEDSLVDVEDQEGEEGDNEQAWHGSSVEEGAANVEQDHRVSIMDQIDWTGVQVDVGLGSGHLGLVGVVSKVSVHPLGSLEHGTEDGQLNEWPDGLSDQGRDDNSADFTVPVDTKIALSSDHEDRG